jgi:hypothetical protein
MAPDEGVKMPPKPNKIELTVIVNGAPTVVEANENAPLRQALEKALAQTKNTGQPIDQWELRDATGVELPLDQKIGAFNFVAGTQLFLNLKAGVGG